MIFAIKPFEIHDGDGIRTTIFFKGCPLRCKWCHNPESLTFDREIFFDSTGCVDCLRCTQICEANTVVDGKHVFVREKCTHCGKCEKICPKGLFSVQGMDLSVMDVVKRVMEEKIFMVGSGGGVTVSGGECLSQADFCAELLAEFKKQGINTAVDTCGFATREAINKVIPYTDTFLYDLKAIDEEVHIKCTGRSNRIILENLRYIDSLGCSIEIRVPYVPDFNDGEMDMIAAFVRTLKNVKLVKVLPYHSYAAKKYASLGMDITLPCKLPTSEEIAFAQSKFYQIFN